MYKNLVILDKKKHANLKLRPIEDLSFAKKTTFIPLLSSELSLISSTFPIVFTSDEAPSLIALISLGGENIAINKEGKWITNYIPSYLRKYPFSLGTKKEDITQKIIMIDEDSSLVSKSKGKQLFKKNGENSATLTKSIKFLTSYDNQMIMTLKIAKIIEDSGILVDSNISVGEGDEKKVLIQGFKVVDRKKLNALSDEILADWVRKGIISFIDLQIKSLENIQTLFNIINQKEQ